MGVVYNVTELLTGYGVSVMRVESLVNLVKQVKRGGVTLLNGKDESQSNE